MSPRNVADTTSLKRSRCATFQDRNMNDSVNYCLPVDATG